MVGLSKVALRCVRMATKKLLRLGTKILCVSDRFLLLFDCVLEKSCILAVFAVHLLRMHLGHDLRRTMPARLQIADACGRPQL